MGFRLNTGSAKARADKLARPFSGYSSAEENFDAGVGQVIDEELSISSLLHGDGKNNRNQQIRNLVEDGKIEQSLIDMHTRGNPGRGKVVDYNAIADYVNWSGSLEIKIDNDEDLTGARNEELAMRRAYRNKVFDTSLTGGKVASFAGGMVAASLDPINVAAMGLASPVMGARAVSKSMYALSIAGRSAALNAAVSVPIEPLVHAWKEEIGAPYTLADSLFNIAASGVLGGTISGLGAAIGKRFDVGELLSKDRDSLIARFEKAGLDVDEAEAMAGFVIESKQAPDPDMPAEKFVKETEEVQESMDSHKPKDSDSPHDLEEMDEVDALYEKIEIEEAEIQAKIDSGQKPKEIVKDPQKPEAPDIRLSTDEEGGGATARELIEEIDTETESLKSKLDCLNGS